MKPDAFSALAQNMSYYNQNAKSYAKQTEALLQEAQIAIFCQSLPSGARVLDVGCGSGRDSAYFLKQGFEVVALDASEALAQEAQERIGQPVVVKPVQEVDWLSAFDAIWCSASLLHVPKVQMPDVLERLHTALRPEGVFFASFKVGKGEQTDALGRFFSYYEPQEIGALCAPFFEKLSLRVDEDSIGRQQQWVSVQAQKRSLVAKPKGIK